jgi:nucleoside phosphorylase
MGMPAAAVLTMKIINNFKPNYLVMAGITAGIKGQVNLGDILVADPSWDYGSGKIKDEEGEAVFYPDPQPIRLNPDIKELLTLISNNNSLLDEIKSKWPAEKPETSLKLHIGPVASGAAVLSHNSVIESIKKHNRKLLGVEMESYGVLYAATHCPKPRPIVIAIKSVCDFADSEKNDNYQRYAAYTSSSILYNLAMNYLDYENTNVIKEATSV